VCVLHAYFTILPNREGRFARPASSYYHYYFHSRQGPHQHLPASSSRRSAATAPPSEQTRRFKRATAAVGKPPPLLRRRRRCYAAVGTHPPPLTRTAPPRCRLHRPRRRWGCVEGKRALYRVPPAAGYPGRALFYSARALQNSAQPPTRVCDPIRSKNTALGVFRTPGGVLGTCFVLWFVSIGVFFIKQMATRATGHLGCGVFIARQRL
jgi:hypothetical protein